MSKHLLSLLGATHYIVRPVRQDFSWRSALIWVGRSTLIALWQQRQLNCPLLGNPNCVSESQNKPPYQKKKHKLGNITNNESVLLANLSFSFQFPCILKGSSKTELLQNREPSPSFVSSRMNSGVKFKGVVSRLLTTTTHQMASQLMTNQLMINSWGITS